MNTELKDGLLGEIIVGGVKCHSISEVLQEDFRRFKSKQPSGLAKYMGKLLCLDLESECENNDDEDVSVYFEIKKFEELDSLHSNLIKQIDDINETFKVKEGI